MTESKATGADNKETVEASVDSVKVSTSPLVLLLSYQPPVNVVNIRVTLVTLLAIVLPLHNHYQLFGSREISLVTAFLGLEVQYVLAVYSLGWLAACTSNKQIASYSNIITTISTLLHLPTPLIALVYCIVTLGIQVVTDFFWYLFTVTCTISLDLVLL